MTTLMQYLSQLGDRFDEYFTIEESWDGSEAENSLSSFPFSVPERELDPEAALQNLARIVPHFTYVRDAANSRIVHVIDGRLAQLPRYAMTRDLPKFTFRGKLDELVQQLATLGIGVAPRMNFVVGDPLAMKKDWTTVLDVDSGENTVRGLLSDFVPLAGYSRVIWTASTQRNDHATTIVNFRGPAAPPR
jgi:hypothetical protein